MPFTHLHVHSEYSVLDGVCPPDALCEHAAAMGMTALALTDHGTMSGIPSFARAAAARGIKPLVGVEAYVVDDDNFHADRQRQKTHHITLLAASPEGYRNLCRLTSKANLEGFYRRPRMHLGWLAEHSEGLIVLSGCLQGIIPQAIVNDRAAHAKERAGWFKSHFGDRFFLEVMDHGIALEQKVARALFPLAKEVGVPVVATNDVHYLEHGGHRVQDLLLAIRRNSPLDDPDRMRADLDSLFMKDEAAMQAVFPEHPEAVAATAAVVEMAEDLSGLFDTAEPLFPAVEVPSGEEGSMGWLTSLANEGAARLYPDGQKEVADRLRHELEVIGRLGYPDYFLAVRDFVAEARGRGIPVGPGRGSAAGSIVAYCLGITRVDPLAHGLLFERFLNEGRKSLPDIDIDFCKLRRDEVIAYIRERHGHDKVAQIVTFNRLKGKLAFRDMARLSGIPEPRFGMVAKSLADGEGLDAVADNAVASAHLAKDPECTEAMAKARLVENTIRNRGVHAAGIVIAPVPLSDLVPLARDRSGAVISEYEMGDLERMGLVKIDVLGIRNLTMLAAAEKEVRRQGGEVDLDTLADGDKKTFALLSRGESEGIFQMEAGNAVRLLRAIKPREIEDLAIINALIRPGPVNSGLTDRYVRRRQGKEKPEPPHPALRGVLADTLGVMVYQEQVMEMAREIAGFSLVEADDLRKAMGKKIKSLMAAQRERFISGCERVGKVNAREAKALFDEVAEFAQYGFNKAHAVAYSVIGYQAAWLKAHWPGQFHAAWLSSFGGNAAEVGGFVARLVGNGERILPPDVNKSLAAFSVEEEGVRYGLASVRHVGEGAAEALVAERTEAGPFKDLGDFALRVSGKVNRRAAESLAAAGAFASMGLDRRELQVVMEEVFKEAEACASMRGQAMLFADAPLVRLRTPSPAEVALVPPDEVLEFGALEAFLTTSPMGAKGKRFRAMGLPPIAEAAKKGGKAAVAGFLSGAKVQKGYGGRKRAEGYLQDRTCRVEWVMYEESLGRVPMEALADGIVVLEGSFRSRRGAEPRFVAESLYPGGEGYEAARRAEAGPAGTPTTDVAAPDTPRRPPLVLGVPESLDEESLGALARLVRTLEPGPLQVILEFPGAKRYRLSHSFTPEAKESLMAWRAALAQGGTPPT